MSAEETRRELWKLIGKLCTECGFCNDLTADGLLAGHRSLSAETFAVEVLRAEGLEPAYHKQHRLMIAARFRECFGDSTSL